MRYLIVAVWASVVWLVVSNVGFAAEEVAKNPILTGPETENRFPPLVVPDGFKATLFACDPLVEYPSVISIGPRPGSLFVAHDYVTGLGVEIVRRDEVRLLEDTNKDGYADRSTVFAGEFNSIQGLAYYDGSVFVMHAPLLTRLRDTNFDGVADERMDLINGLGLPPEENSNRLHCANGVTAGHDGWLYLSLGDRGCDVKRPEGDRLVFQQGGILRVRGDGSGLHVFSTGLRNVYDVALDAELNVFVRDNENDGGDYMIRVNHCFFGSDHGYPYHYYERPGEPMRPLADLGRGSSAGGTSYLETAFPKEFQQSLFFCEWGRAVVRYRQTPKSSSFAPMTEVDFAAGATDDPYGFKPTDLVVDYDGSLLISDWCDGQRPKRGRGRIYRISHESAKKPETKGTVDVSEVSVDLVRHLNAPGYHSRVMVQQFLDQFGEKAVPVIASAWGDLGPPAKMHAVWLIARNARKDGLHRLLSLAESEADARVQRQIIRAIGDLADPVLTEHSLEEGRGDPDTGEAVAKLGEGADPRVLLEVLIVLRRLKWEKSPQWIAKHLTAADPALDHAAQQALRNADNWPEVVRLLDESPRLRRLALQAMAEQRVPYLATQLIERLEKQTDPKKRSELADALSRIVRKRPEWEYWGFRPAPRTPASIDWEQTEAIVAALNSSLKDQDYNVRAATLEHMRREGVAVEFAWLSNWLPHESDPKRAAAILTALESHDADKVRQLLVGVIQDKDVAEATRLEAFSSLVAKLPAKESALIRLLGMSVENRVLAAVISELGERRDPLAEPQVLIHALSPLPAVRSASLRSLGQLGSEKARELIKPALEDSNTEIQLAAAESAGPVGAQDSIAQLYKLAGRKDRRFVAACLTSLRMLNFELAVPIAVDALEHPDTQLPALRYVREFGGTRQADAVAEVALTSHSSELQREVLKTLVEWQKRKPADQATIPKAIATIQGRSGRPLIWGVSRGDDSPPETHFAEGATVEVTLTGAKAGEETTWRGSTLIRVPTRRDVEFLCSATGRMIVRLDGQPIHVRDKPGSFRTDSDRFQALLTPETRRLSVEVTTSDAKPRFQLRFRPVSSKADHERLTKLALSSRGNSGRGRDSFMNKEKAGCIKCHTLNGEGGRIGPDLTGIGRRFSRIHLIESILEPSRTVAPSYATHSLVLENGRILSGIKVEEKRATLVIGDNQGKLNEVAKSQIEQLIRQPTSTMPEGLEKKMTDREFLDLIAFLESQKSTPPKKTSN